MHIKIAMRNEIRTGALLTKGVAQLFEWPRRNEVAVLLSVLANLVEALLTPHLDVQYHDGSIVASIKSNLLPDPFAKHNSSMRVRGCKEGAVEQPLLDDSTTTTRTSC